MSDSALFAQQEWAAALGFLHEAEQFPAEALPRMATHAAYYTMYHGARAILIKLEGLAAPLKHSVVVSRFGYQAKQSNEVALMRAAHEFSIVRKARLDTDYDITQSPLPETAVLAVKRARSFLELCARLHGFPPP